MRQERITPTLMKRVTNRANLSILLLIGGMFCLFQALVGPPGVTAAELSTPFIMLLGHLAFSPLPWQWTGDDSPVAGLSRGFIQALLFNLAWVALVFVLMHLGTLGHEGPRDMGPPPMGDLRGPRPHLHQPRVPGLGFVLLNVAFGIVFGWAFAEKEGTEARERRIAGLLRQSRSRALQNQMEPHVLYNALNGLSELVHEDPPAAEEMIARLADLFRLLTHHGDQEFVPLEKERKLVEAYLSMEQMRLGDRLVIQWDWPAWADEVVLPPLFLQPMVENAIKHGISPSGEGGEVRISCSREDGGFALAVANSGKALATGPRDGVGLANLKARLELWAEAQGTFTLEQLGTWTVATVRWKGRKP